MAFPTEPRIRFSPTIELGHLLQAFVMLVGLGGWALVGYETIEKQLEQHAAETALYKQRLAIDEASIVDLRESLRSSSVETRQQLGKIIDQIGDLRALVSGMGHVDGARR